jgi:hypothetical protein
VTCLLAAHSTTPRSTGWIPTSAGPPDICAVDWVDSSAGIADLDEHLMASRVTVFPVPVSRKAGAEEPDPAQMAAEIERLRAENAVLRERLGAVHAIALEREGTIEDLRHALQMLPSVWAEKLEERSGSVVEEADQPAAPPFQVTTAPPEPAPRPDRSPVPPDPGSSPTIDQAEAFFAEIAALRVRLERRQLEAEQEFLEQERKRLMADIEWTRKWQRSRGRAPTDS